MNTLTLIKSTTSNLRQHVLPWLLCLWACTAATFAANSPTVIYSTLRLNGAAFSNVIVQVTPIQLSALSNSTVAPFSYSNVTRADGTLTITNMVPQSYRVTMRFANGIVSFTNCFTGVSGTVYATDYLCGAQPTNGVAWSTTQSDLRYPSIAGSGLTPTTNAGRITWTASSSSSGSAFAVATNAALVATNPVAVRFTNAGNVAFTAISNAAGASVMASVDESVPTLAAFNPNTFATNGGVVNLKNGFRGTNASLYGLSVVGSATFTETINVYAITLLVHDDGGADKNFNWPAPDTNTFAWLGTVVQASNVLTARYGPQVASLSNSVADLTNYVTFVLDYVDSQFTFLYTDYVIPLVGATNGLHASVINLRAATNAHFSALATKQHGSAALTNASGNVNLTTNVLGAGTVTVTSNNAGVFTITGVGAPYAATTAGSNAVANMGGFGTNTFLTNALILNLRLGLDTNAAFVISNSSATGPGVLHLCRSTNGIIGASVWSVNLTNGNVGIGTASPNAALEVHGQIRTTNSLAMSNTVGQIWTLDNQDGGFNLNFSRNGTLVAQLNNAANWNISSITVNGSSLADGSRNVKAGTITSGGNNVLAQATVTNSTAAQVGLRVDTTGTNDLAQFNVGTNRVVTIATNGFVGIGTATPSSTLDVTGRISGTVGSSTNKYRVGGTLTDFTADAANGTTLETDLYSYMVQTNTFVVDKDKIMFEVAGRFTGGTSTKQLKVYLSGTAVFDSGALGISSAADWHLRGFLIRSNATVVRASVTLNTSFASLSSYSQRTDISGLTLTTTNIFRLTGTAAGVGAASSDITANQGTIDWKPAGPQ